MSFLEYIWKIIPPATRPDALSQAAAVEVTIARNDFGGWSIFPANQTALCLFGGNAPTGNFGSRADAHRRAANDNCWTVIERAAELRASRTATGVFTHAERAGVTAASLLSRS